MNSNDKTGIKVASNPYNRNSYQKRYISNSSFFFFKELTKLAQIFLFTKVKHKGILFAFTSESSLVLLVI